MAKRNSALSEIMDEKCELEMTPMIDVTFLLLIFFMCTLKFKILEGKLSAYLPKDVGVQAFDTPPVEKVDIRLDVRNSGTKLRWDSKAKKAVAYTENDAKAGLRFYYGDDRVVEYTVGGKMTTQLSEVVRRLTTFKKGDPEMKATVDARQDVTQKDVVVILDAAIDAGYDDITFKGSYER